jgi:hypothetical protein
MVMNEVERYTNGEELEDSLGGQFTEEEILVAKSILTSKALAGLSSRLGRVGGEIGYKNEALALDILNFHQHIDKVMKIQQGLTEQYASKLGISKERYREIWDYVYEHESFL